MPNTRGVFTRMFVEDLEGNVAEWKMNGKEVVLDRRPRSALHRAARELIKKKFPTLLVLEEVSIKPRPRQVLYLDFYLPLRKLAIEVHGEQHYKFNSLFHSSASDFLQQRKNDKQKTEWCDINGIELIVLSYNQEDNWSNLL